MVWQHAGYLVRDGHARLRSAVLGMGANARPSGGPGLARLAVRAAVAVLAAAAIARLTALIGTFVLDPPEPWEPAIQAVAGAWLRGYILQLLVEL